MSSDIAMKAHDLRKIYRLYPNPTSRLKQLIFGKRRQYYREFVALDGVDFELKRGEVLGVVGRNGAGKSTLLQLICGTLSASSGELKVNGRIAALLELGAGFNPEFTGRENIYFAAAVIGLKRSDIDLILEDIIDFSGIRPFIDQPVKTYSSGMFVRLAFSVATSVEPDILVIDEALSVGDGDFARRSFERIMDMRDAGKTILFCSHSLYQVEVLCSRAIWLDAGKVMEEGSPDKVVPNYQNFLDSLSLDDSDPSTEESVPQVPEEPLAEDEEEIGTGTNEELIDKTVIPVEPPSIPVPSPAAQTRLDTISVAADGIKGTHFVVQSDQSCLQIDVNFFCHIPGEIPGVAIVIHAASGNLVTSCASWSEGFYPEIDAQGNGRMRIDFDKLPLLKGRYNVGVLLFCPRGIMLYDEKDPVATLEVEQQGVARGFVNIPHSWAPEKEEKTANNRWLAIDARAEHETELLALFERSFKHRMPIAQWRWKYALSLSPGTIVLENDKVIAFNGAMPRKALLNGVETSIVHIGDSMVSPEARGILTRKGPFYLSVHHFYENYIGPGKRYPLSFGFPHARVAKLGIKQGLYCEIDQVIQASWPPKETYDSELEYRLLTVEDESIVNTLWLRMQESLDQYVVGCRNFAWIKHRYLDKPNNDYLPYLVFNKTTQQTLGLVVLRYVEDNRIEILDIVASNSDVQPLVDVACYEAHKIKATSSFSWLTRSALAWYASTNPAEEATDVIIAGSAVNDIEYSLSTTNKWWLMGGDTDFR